MTSAMDIMEAQSESGCYFSLKNVKLCPKSSTEQKDTMNNIVSAFKLESGESIQFKGYVVRLDQKINLTDGQTEYAISVQ